MRSASEKVSGEQAEKPVTKDETDGNPQSVSEDARRSPVYLNDYVTDLDEVIAESG